MCLRLGPPGRFQKPKIVMLIFKRESSSVDPARDITVVKFHSVMWGHGTVLVRALEA